MQRYAETLERWTTYYARVGIGAMGYGAVLLRRRDTPVYRLRVDEAPPAGINPVAADELQRLLEIEDRWNRWTTTRCSSKRSASCLAVDSSRSPHGRTAASEPQMQRLRAIKVFGRARRSHRRWRSCYLRLTQVGACRR